MRLRVFRSIVVMFYMYAFHVIVLSSKGVVGRSSTASETAFGAYGDVSFWNVHARCLCPWMMFESNNAPFDGCRMGNNTCGAFTEHYPCSVPFHQALQAKAVEHFPKQSAIKSLPVLQNKHYVMYTLVAGATGMFLGASMGGIRGNEDLRDIYDRRTGGGLTEQQVCPARIKKIQVEVAEPSRPLRRSLLI